MVAPEEAREGRPGDPDSKLIMALRAATFFHQGTFAAVPRSSFKPALAECGSRVDVLPSF
jgi:hypothetical protein